MLSGRNQSKTILLLAAGMAVLAAMLLCWHFKAGPKAGVKAKNFPQNVTSARQELNGRSKPDAVAQIIRWLDSGTDAATGADLKLAPDGSLAEVPTLRAFLLDELIKTDRDAAAGYAQKILGQKTSADEWALALRAYALGSTNADTPAYLREKFEELLHDDAWRTNPSVGFLEAFDVAVYAKDTGLTPELSTMLTDKSNRATAHAAYLTMDRLVQTQPNEMFSQLQAHPEWMAGNESTRADFFARADVREAGQRSTLENYLLNPALSPVELQQFAGIFPNANFMVSYNLLTGTATPNSAELAARDRAALQTVDEWLADPRFENRRGQLEAIKQRLEVFVKQAGN